MLEFDNNDITYTSEERHLVHYNDVQVGHFFTDLIVDNKIILELKSDERITSSHIAQLFTYLKASKINVGYILAFGSQSLKFKRLIV